MVSWQVGILKNFVVFYFVLGVVGVIDFDCREKRKSKK